MDKDRESKFIITTVVVGDLLIFNTIFYLFFFDIPSEWNYMQYCVFANLCYLVNILLFRGVVLHKHGVRTDEILAKVMGNVVGFTLLWLLGLAISDFDLHLSWHLLLLSTVLFLALGSYRVVYHTILKYIRKRGSCACRVVFNGSTENMTRLYEEMSRRQETGFVVVGYFDDKENPLFPAKYLGKCDEIGNFLANNNIQRLYCSLPSPLYIGGEGIGSIVDHCSGQ